MTVRESYGCARGRFFERSRAARNASGISRRDASMSSYRNARSANGSVDRTRSSKSKRYSSSSSRRTVASSSPAATYRPCPTLFRSPSRTRRVSAKVIDERLASGMAVMISRVETARPAPATYSYTRWMTALMPATNGLSVNNVLLTIGRVYSSGGARR